MSKRIENKKEYNCWINMKQRCINEKHPEYFRYGASGIFVCDEWLDSFDNFLNDMGKSKNHESIDRIDPSGPYCKSNCRWADKTTQSFNQKNSKNNKSGIKGVNLEKQTQKYKAFITKNGKQITIGRYSDFFEACCARKSMQNKLYGDLNNGA